MSHQAEMKHSWIAVIPLLALWTSPAAAAFTWYVATSGMNNAGCGSSTSPCATVSYALSSKVGAGDTIKVRAGTYAEGLLIDNTTKHDNVTITADDTSNKPQLNGTVNVLSGVSGITLSYLKIRGASAPSSGWWVVVMLRGQSPTVDNSEIWNGGTCIYIRSSGKSTNITNNNLHNCGVWRADDSHAINLVNDNADALPANWSEKLYIYNNVIRDGGGDGFQDTQGQARGVASKYIEVAYNDIYGWDEDGMDFKGSQFVRIHHNKIHDNGGREWGVGINTQDTYALGGDYEIWNNQIYNNWGTAIFQKWGAPRMKVWNNLIYGNSHNPIDNTFAVYSEAGCGMEFCNNIVVNNDRKSGTYKVGGIQSLCSNNIYKNNILYNNGQSTNSYGNIHGSEGLGTFDRNYVYPTTPGKSGTNAVTSSSPGFVNAAGLDFHLLSTSPNVNTGTALPSSYATDYDGTSRPQGAGWDIGAYEYGGVIAALQPPSSLRVVP